MKTAKICSSWPRKLTVKVDPGTSLGPVKPLHGINNAPYIYQSSKRMHYLKEAHIPFCRLHDTCGAYGGFRYVDIANIFRDFRADETLPENYDFAATDDLIASIQKQGAETFYRLGCTIENDRFGCAYRIYPPEDPEKWARICEHIIRHYNEGWAEGYHFGLRYWEIWNEPDNEPVIEENPMWRGTMEQYFELYRITANHLKSCFPDLKIGGYASCGFYSVVQKEVAPEANVSPRAAYFTEFFLKFMDYIAAPATAAPLDFFSWHSYADEQSTVKFAEFVQKTLLEHGFDRCESIFNEWNTGTWLRGTLQDASNIASMIITMHDAPVDKMMYYDGQFYATYGGLFSAMTFEPLKAYYALKAYGQLYADEGGRVQAEVTEGDAKALKVIASKRFVLLVNRTSEPVYIDLATPGFTKLYVLDTQHDLEPVNFDGTHIPLEGFALALAEVE